VNVRVIAATNRNLEEAIKSGHFREDLYYRLNVIPIGLPPLRSRIVDVPLLVRHFLGKHQKRNSAKVGIGDEAMALLSQYAFPGNIRELENIIQRAISFAKGPIIARSEVEAYLKSGSSAVAQPLVVALDKQTYPTLKSHLRKIERDFVLARLKDCNWSVSDAAKVMEITRTALHNKMKKLGINGKELRQGGVSAEGSGSAGSEDAGLKGGTGLARKG
jgi:two-component system nitrogen regulation response regulator NtrX